MQRLILLVLTALLAQAGTADADAAKRRSAKNKKAATRPARVLIYSGTIGFRHNSIPHGNATIVRLGRVTGRWTTQVIEKPEGLTKGRLAASDIVLWHSTTGAESPFSDAQENDYMAWVGCGGGHMGVHASTDSYKDWPGWAELTGAFFKIHPLTPGALTDSTDPHYEGNGQPEATVLVQDGNSPLTFGGFTDSVHAAARNVHYAQEQPLSWTGSYRGLNRIFYTNLGHSGATWNRPDFQDALIEGTSFVAAKRPSLTCLRKAGIAPPPAPPKRKK